MLAKAISLKFNKKSMERRRLLSEDYIAWLKSLTCQFYAPLDGSLTDVISGQVGIQQNNNTALWNNDEKAYLFTKDASTSPYGQSIVRWSGLNMNYDITNMGQTLLYEINVVKWGRNSNGVNTYGFIVPLCLGGRTMASNINTNQITIGTNTWVKIAQVYSKYEGTPRYSYIYVDGQVGFSYDRGSTVATGNANTNIMMDVNKCFDSYSYGYTDCKFYLRNAMAFTAALDIDTIKKIQGL